MVKIGGISREIIGGRVPVNSGGWRGYPSGFGKSLAGGNCCPVGISIGGSGFGKGKGGGLGLVTGGLG